jgi:hypothetical protein
MTTIPNPTPDGDYYRIIKGSSLSFMCPPGHPNHFYEVRGARRGQIMKNPHTITSVDSAATTDAGYMPTEIVRQARELLAKAELVNSEDWQRHVYGYFRGTYSPDGVDRNVSHSLIIGHKWYVDKGSQYDSLNRSDEVLAADDPRVIPEHHMGYLLIKEYFPDAKPRLDLIADASGGYGQRPCAKCGTALQYEAKVDRFAEAITCKLSCPEGGEHA